MNSRNLQMRMVGGLQGSQGSVLDSGGEWMQTERLQSENVQVLPPGRATSCPEG